MIAERLGQAMIDAGYWPVLLSFSQPLKEMVAQEIGHSRKDDGARDVMLRIGDEQRAKDPDVFVKLLSRKVDEAFVAGCSPIITDVRRENEWNWCCDAGLYTAYVEAPIEDRMARLRAMGEPESVATSSHATETEAYSFPWHLRVFNAHSVNPDQVAWQCALDVLRCAGW